MRRLLSCFAFLLAAPAVAQTPPATPAQAAQPDPAFTARVKELPAILAGTGDYEGFFSPGFKKQVPKAKFDAISTQISATNGPAGAVLGVRQLSPWLGIARVQYRDAVALVQLAVDPAPPHRVSGLLIKGFETGEKTLPEVTAAIDGLHGDTGYAIARLGAGAPQILAQRNLDKPYAIGSAFKLVILAELVRATNEGERKWDDLVTLDGGPLPGGGYTQKPAGTQVSLRELATQMISISDNSATDILLKTLGRAKVEAMMPVLGIADPARNRPFLSTLDMFRLKGIGKGALAQRYLTLDEAGRRKMLDGEIARLPAIMVDPNVFKARKPVMIDALEWFESPADLVRVMDWLRRNTEGPQGADARAVLSKNPGIGPDARAGWQWVGFKGGSEPGVMNMTLLLQAKNGDWYVITGSWNDTAREVEQGRFASLIGKAAEVMAP